MAIFNSYVCHNQAGYVMVCLKIGYFDISSTGELSFSLWKMAIGEVYSIVRWNSHDHLHL